MTRGGPQSYHRTVNVLLNRNRRHGLPSTYFTLSYSYGVLYQHLGEAVSSYQQSSNSNPFDQSITVSCHAFTSNEQAFRHSEFLASPLRHEFQGRPIGMCFTGYSDLWNETLLCPYPYSASKLHCYPFTRQLRKVSLPQNTSNHRWFERNNAASTPGSGTKVTHRYRRLRFTVLQLCSTPE